MISKRYNEQMGNYLAKLAREKKPVTNADRIRAMSDEELAEMLHNAGGNWFSREYWLDWMRQECDPNE